MSWDKADRDYAAGIILGLVMGLCLGVLWGGYEAGKAKEACEENLTRKQQCKIIAVPATQPTDGARNDG